MYVHDHSIFSLNYAVFCRLDILTAPIFACLFHSFYNNMSFEMFPDLRHTTHVLSLLLILVGNLDE